MFTVDIFRKDIYSYYILSNAIPDPEVVIVDVSWIISQIRKSKNS